MVGQNFIFHQMAWSCAQRERLQPSRPLRRWSVRLWHLAGSGWPCSGSRQGEPCAPRPGGLQGQKSAFKNVVITAGQVARVKRVPELCADWSARPGRLVDTIVAMTQYLASTCLSLPGIDGFGDYD